MTTTRTNTSAFPNGLDTDLTIPHVIDEISEIRAINFNALKDAIIAVETALGIDPQGEYATVADRLDNIEDSFFSVYASGTGDTINGPSDDEDGAAELGLGLVSGMEVSYDDDGDGNVAARLVFGEDCNCQIVLDDRASETGTFDNPSTSTKWTPTSQEIIDSAAMSVVPLSILGNSAFGAGASSSGTSLRRRIRIHDDVDVLRSVRVKDFIRAKNADFSIDGLQYKGLRSKITRKAIIFSEELDENPRFNIPLGSNVYTTSVLLRDKDRGTPTNFERTSLGLQMPAQPATFSSGNVSIDGDLEIQGKLHVKDYMNVVAAQTAVDIEDIKLVVPKAEYKTNMLFVTFSAVILDVTENNTRGGIYLNIDGNKVDHPMIYKGTKLTEDDIYDELEGEGIKVFPQSFYDTPLVEYEDPVTGTETRNRLVISPNGSYSGMSTMIMVSDSSVSGVALDGSVPRFNPEKELTITMSATQGVSSVMHTVLVWSTGATNMEIVTGWNTDGTPVKESWTPVM